MSYSAPNAPSQVAPYGYFTCTVDCHISPFVPNNVALGAQWATQVRDWLYHAGHPTLDGFNVYEFLLNPAHPVRPYIADYDPNPIAGTLSLFWSIFAPAIRRGVAHITYIVTLSAFCFRVVQLLGSFADYWCLSRYRAEMTQAAAIVTHVALETELVLHWGKFLCAPCLEELLMTNCELKNKDAKGIILLLGHAAPRNRMVVSHPDYQQHRPWKVWSQSNGVLCWWLSDFKGQHSDEGSQVI
ncbi:hypothetical protein DFH07DRAFT_781720 [Mycena maculata]|uniref:Uncharacterized protein n=1 Tax=Mycena maculata TaxID=230809 RepID=A0AAD7HWL4_9AGAR|nr:hypothetical protein DFH07DRAFT_781720 [Mycena maculata]